MVEKLKYGGSMTEAERQEAIDQLIDLNMTLLNGNAATSIPSAAETDSFLEAMELSRRIQNSM